MAIANTLQLEAARGRAVHIRFNTAPVANLKSLSISVAVSERFYCSYVTLRYVVSLNFDPVTLTTFDLEHLWCASAVVKLCTKFELNRAIRGGVIAV